MGKYQIFSGMSGGFGGAQYQGTYDFKTFTEAEDYAFDLTLEIYASYEGCHGILSWNDCRNDLIDSFPDTEWDDEDVDNRYQEELESWIEYYVIPVSAEGEAEDNNL